MDSSRSCWHFLANSLQDFDLLVISYGSVLLCFHGWGGNKLAQTKFSLPFKVSLCLLVCIDFLWSENKIQTDRTYKLYKFWDTIPFEAWGLYLCLSDMSTESRRLDCQHCHPTRRKNNKMSEKRRRYKKNHVLMLFNFPLIMRGIWFVNVLEFLKKKQTHKKHKNFSYKWSTQFETQKCLKWKNST